MSAIKYDKLVRDRIPEIIKEKGKECKFRIASTEEYREKLVEKLLEEVLEFIETPCVEELADIQEVVEALMNEHKWESLRATTQFKKITRGSFRDKIILEEVSG